MQQYTLTKIGQENVYNGVNNDGKPYTLHSVGLQTKEMPNTWINIAFDAVTSQWKEGDVVTFKIFTKEKAGKTYYNAKLPDRIDMLDQQVTALADQIDKIKQYLREQKQPKPLVKTDSAATASDLPF